MIKSKILTENNILNYLDESTASSSGSEIKYFDIKRIYNDSIFKWNRSNKTTGSCVSLGYGDKIYLAGIADDGLWKSCNGIDWNKVTNFKAQNSEMTPISICYGAGKFIISTIDNGIYYSDSLLSKFTKIESPHVFREIYYNGSWLAAGYDGLFKSSDGITWNKCIIEDEDPDNDPGFYDLKYVGPIFGEFEWVATSDDGIWKSIDGNTWTRFNIEDPDDHSDISDISFTSVIKYGDGAELLAACEEFSYSGIWLYSSNTWTRVVDQIDFSLVENPKKLFIIKDTIFLLADNGVFYFNSSNPVPIKLIDSGEDDSFNCLLSDNNISLIGSNNGLFYNKLGYNSYYGHIEDTDIHVSGYDRNRWNRVSDKFISDSTKNQLEELISSISSTTEVSIIRDALVTLLNKLTEI